MKLKKHTKKFGHAALVAATITPGLTPWTPANASEQAPIVVAQAKTKISKEQTRRLQQQIRKELSLMSAEQKRRLGVGRVNVQLKANNQVAISKCCHTFSHGVGCGGTPNFTNGITCCAIFKAN